MTVVGHTRLLDALTALAVSLVDALGADACAISRVLGDALLFACQAASDGHDLALGQGYLVSEHPETRAVLDTGEPHAVCVGEPGCGAAEEQVLRDLGFGALLIVPLALHGERWGVVEVYREAPCPFGAIEVRTALGLIDALGA